MLISYSEQFFALQYLYLSSWSRQQSWQLGHQNAGVIIQSLNHFIVIDSRAAFGNSAFHNPQCLTQVQREMFNTNSTLKARYNSFDTVSHPTSPTMLP